jgi:4a-hydroxytetrahydrobiopterin dehydratase
MKRRKLSQAEIEGALAEIGGWTLHNGHLHRELRFDGFVDAFGFMSSMALISESMNHHPAWHNVYNRLVIDLSTHDAGGVTELDLEWARRANKLLALAAPGR